MRLFGIEAGGVGMLQLSLSIRRANPVPAIDPETNSGDRLWVFYCIILSFLLYICNEMAVTAGIGR